MLKEGIWGHCMRCCVAHPELCSATTVGSPPTAPGIWPFILFPASLFAFPCPAWFLADGSAGLAGP